MKSKIFSMILMASSLSGTVLTQERFGQQRVLSAEQDRNYQSWIGQSLGWSMLGNYAAFIGTATEVVGPKQESGDTVDPRELSYEKVSVTIDEWLLGERGDLSSELLLDHVPLAMTLSYGTESRGAVWNNVELRVGNKLLIVFDPSRVGKQDDQEIISKFGLVVSRTDLFPAIQETLAFHARYLQDPNEILKAPAVFKSNTSHIFNAYLFNYLYWMGGRTERSNNEAYVISELLGSSFIPQSAQHMLAMPLERSLLNIDNPVSTATRKKVATRLVSLSCGDDVIVGKVALDVLIMMSQENAIDFRSGLTEPFRQKLIRNYQAFRAAGTTSTESTAFEVQLGISRLPK